MKANFYPCCSADNLTQGETIPVLLTPSITIVILGPEHVQSSHAHMGQHDWKTMTVIQQKVVHEKAS